MKIPPHRHRLAQTTLVVCLATALGLNATTCAPARANGPLSTSARRAGATSMPHRGAGLLARQRALATDALPPPASPSGSNVVAVTNCDDNGDGSLRNAIAIAGEGDTIDLRNLTCSTITVAQHAIVARQENLRLVGPGPDRLTISGGHAAPVLWHYGRGTLALYNVTIADGRFSDAGVAAGLAAGCITTDGTLRLQRTVVTGCEHFSNTAGITAYGGAIIAFNLDLLDSAVTASTVGAVSASTLGGGAWVTHALYAYNSTVAGNFALGYHGTAGGIGVNGDALIRNSTISGNTAAFDGGLALFGHYQANQFLIADTTISGNSALSRTGGIETDETTLIANSTIAFNFEGGGTSGGIFVGNDATLRLVSSIVSDNDSGTAENDIGGTSGAQVIGTKNLVRASSMTLPPDTIRADPMLAPLAANGGATLTHAIAATSPAVDGGTTSYAPSEYDQRGFGRARLVGGATDIGAYERQSTGVVRTVASCADAGSGSLRDTLALAASGDTIDLSSLACSTITLSNGALAIDVGNLALTGPGADRLTIDGAGADRVVKHTGAGLFAASGLTFAHGTCSVNTGCYVNYNVNGGCIESYSAAHLADVVVRSCRVESAGIGNGGAVDAAYLALDRTTVSDSEVTGYAVFGYGGGVWGDRLAVRDSTIARNVVDPSGASASGGGGIGARFAMTVDGSTITGNSAFSGGGIAFAGDGFGAPPAVIANSTISGNVGGGAVLLGTLSDIHNSTLTANSAVLESDGAGIRANGQLRLDSTIVFGNTGGSAEPLDILSFSRLAIAGANNLVGTASVPLPPGTISADPLLGPLVDNGGPTWTHALGAGSPAIDAGSNPAHLMSDQRGAGFLRVSGAAADIGAFETQAIGDAIFGNGFD
jgi:hypothetical protein